MAESDGESFGRWLRSTNKLQRVGISVGVAGALVANLGAVVLLGYPASLAWPLVAGAVLLIAGSVLVMAGAPRATPGGAPALVQRPDRTQWIGAALLYTGPVVGGVAALAGPAFDAPGWWNGACLVAAIGFMGAGLALTGSLPQTVPLLKAAQDPRRPSWARPGRAMVALAGAAVFMLAFIPFLQGAFSGPALAGSSVAYRDVALRVGGSDLTVDIPGNGASVLLASSAEGTGPAVTLPANTTQVLLNTTGDAAVSKVELGRDGQWTEIGVHAIGDHSWIVRQDRLGGQELRATVSTGPRLSATTVPLHLVFLDVERCSTTTFNDGKRLESCHAA